MTAMTKEAAIAASTGLSREELRRHRQSGQYEGNVDWLMFGRSMVWTECGLRRLAADLKFDVRELLPDGPVTRGAEVVKARILNTRLVRCLIDGESEPQIVNVGNNRLYKPGLRVTVWKEGNGWKGYRRPRIPEGDKCR